MWSVRHILVPLDFSDASELALDRAIDIASQLGADVTVLHVTAKEPDEQDRAALEARVLPRKDRGVELRTELRCGPTLEAVLDAISDFAADLMVVGSHGRTGRARRVLGSVAERIVRAAAVPVLVVHSHDEVERPPAQKFGVGHEAGVRQP